MEVTVSEKAMKKVLSKGGKVAIDFINPVGCGKVSEVSISTNLQGRNTSRYRKLSHGEIQIYYSKDLERFTKSLDLFVKSGLVGSKLTIRQSLAFPSDCKLP